MKLVNCRICNNSVQSLFDFGSQELANRLTNTLDEALTLPRQELHATYCKQCYSVQLNECVDKEILYDNYLYSTPKSELLSSHYKQVKKKFIQHGLLTGDTFLLEVGSNNGEFLKVFLEEGVDVLGVDPASNIVQLANSSGVPTICDYFNKAVAMQILKEKEKKADLIVARHCFAHNEKPNQILEGMTELLADTGTIMIENAYAINTLLRGEFDQIYHEHMYYYSLTSLKSLLNRYGVYIYDVDFSSVHGGSIIVFASADPKRGESELIKKLEIIEKHLFSEKSIKSFQNLASDNIMEIRSFVDLLHAADYKIDCYGATAKAIHF